MIFNQPIHRNFYDCADVPLQAEDKLIVYVAPQNIRQIEKIFYR